MVGELKVLPTADDVEWAMLEEARGRGWVEGTTFVDARNFFLRLAEHSGALARRTTPLLERLLLASCAADVKELPFSDHVDEPSFVRGALRVLSELSAAAISPERFAAAVSSLPAKKAARVQFFAKLYERYRGVLHERRWTDEADIFATAKRGLETRGLPDWLGRAGAIRVAGDPRWRTGALACFMSLVRVAEKRGLPVRLSFAASGSPFIDGALDELFSPLERELAGATRFELEKDLPEPLERPAAQLAGVLFAEREARASEPPHGMELLAFADAREELDGIARRVRRFIADGAHPDEVAVVLPSLDASAAQLETRLREFGVPVRSARAPSLLETRWGRLALRIPQLVDDGFPVADVSELLVRLGITGPSGELPILAFREAAIRDDRLGGERGRGAYATRLDALIRRTRDPGRAAGLKVLAREVSSLIEACASLPERASFGEYASRTRAVLENFRQRMPRDLAMLRRAALGTDAASAAWIEDVRAAERVNELLVELLQVSAMAGFDKHPLDRAKFARWLVDAGADVRLSAAGPKAGVRITTIERIGTRRLTHICIARLNDGELPKREDPDSVLSNEDRHALNRALKANVFAVQAGEAEARAPVHILEQRRRFYLALCAATDAIVLSRSRAAEDGKEQLPSPFFEEVERASGIRARVLPRSLVAAASEVASPRERRERLALELFANAELRSSPRDHRIASERTRYETEPWFAHLTHVSRMEHERVRFFTSEAVEPGAFSGAIPRVGHSAALLETAFRFDEAHPLSASMLGRFGNCSYQGFLSYALRLREPDESGEELDPRDLGSFWHRVMELLFGEERTGELTPEEIVERVRSAASSWEQQGHTGHPALWKLGQERAARMTLELLTSENGGLPFAGHQPAHTELTFGRRDSAPAWRRVPLKAPGGDDVVYVEGTIDRIDRGAESVGVVDYKASAAKSLKQLADALLETDFQLPLYLFAARKSGHEGAMQAALVFLKGAATADFASVLAKAEVGLDELLSEDPGVQQRIRETHGKNLPERVWERIRAMRAGRFGARPADCGRCRFGAVCRISNRQLPEVFS